MAKRDLEGLRRVRAENRRMRVSLLEIAVEFSRRNPPVRATCGHLTFLQHRETGVCFECWVSERGRGEKETR